MTSEEHARDFLEYVAKNEKRLKKNLKKNITYDPDIFDDVFQDSIIKVYDRIMKGEIIKDFEQYFFIASKFHYINTDNKNKKKKNSSDRSILENETDLFPSFDNQWKQKEERNEKINELFWYLSDELNKVFTPVEADIFLIYYRLKSEKAGISYKKMAQITEKPLSEITDIIKKIKKYIRTNEDIINKKKELLK